MAGKAKKGSSRKAHAAQPAYKAVLYGLDAGTEKGDAVRAVLAELGIPVRSVGVQHLGDSVGSLAGCLKMPASRKPYEGEVFTGEFLLFCNVPNALLNDALSLMRERGCSVELKAALTRINRLWPLATLMETVAREHETMHRADAEGEQDR